MTVVAVIVVVLVVLVVLALIDIHVGSRHGDRSRTGAVGGALGVIDEL
jgi:hypothetical protein